MGKKRLKLVFLKKSNRIGKALARLRIKRMLK